MPRINKDFATKIPKDTPHTREHILQEGIRLTVGDRNVSYGNPNVNFLHMAGLLTAYFRHKITYEFSAEDAAMIMALAKTSRIAGGSFKLDNYIDGATYLAIAGECAEGENHD